MAVEFEYWGESEIGIRMASEFNRGRHWFWFNEERLSNEWFRNRIDEAVANARDRFSPEINVDLPIRGVFDALGRTPRFYKKLVGLYSEAYIKFKSLRAPVDPPGSTKSPEGSVRTLAVQLFATMELSRDNMISFVVEPSVGIHIIPFSKTKA